MPAKTIARRGADKKHEDDEVVEVTPALKERAKKVDGRLVELKDQVGKAYMEISKLLHEVMKKKLYQALGFEKFEEYVEKRMAFQSRKGFYLLRIHRDLVEGAGISEERVAQLDWTKAAAVAQVAEDASAENVERLMKVAENEPLERVRQEVQRVKAEIIVPEKDGKSGGSKVPEVLVREQIALYAPQHDLWVKALKIAGQVGGSDKKPRQIELVCMEFLSSRMEQLGRSGSLQWFLKRLESAFGVKLIALDPKTMDPVYGGKILKELEEAEGK